MTAEERAFPGGIYSTWAAESIRDYVCRLLAKGREVVIRRESFPSSAAVFVMPLGRVPNCVRASAILLSPDVTGLYAADMPAHRRSRARYSRRNGIVGLSGVRASENKETLVVRTVWRFFHMYRRQTYA